MARPPVPGARSAGQDGGGEAVGDQRRGVQTEQRRTEGGVAGAGADHGTVAHNTPGCDSGTHGALNRVTQQAGDVLDVLEKQKRTSRAAGQHGDENVDL